MDLSISLVKRSITYLNRTISAKLEKNLNPEEEIPSNQEKNKENPRFFETFGKNEGKIKENEENGANKTPTLKKPFQNQINYNKNSENGDFFKRKPLENHEKQEKTVNEAFFNEKQGKTFPKSIELVNPSLKYMIEGNYCPPPMVLVKVLLFMLILYHYF